MEKKRIDWIDIAKFIGMFAIYLGHNGGGTGNLTVLVFQFHVPLFFFLSGCVSNYDHEANLFRYAKKRFVRIMIPFYAFALISLLVDTIMNSLGTYDICRSLALILAGCIRNTFVAPGLWFLSCLFIMELVFWFVKKLKFKPLLLAVSFACFLIAQLLIEPRPIVTPHWPYNADSMLYYLLFFVLGYCLYPVLTKFLALETRRSKILFVCLLILSGCYFAVVYTGRSIAHIIPVYPVAVFTLEVIQPFIIILFVLCLSKLLSGISIFTRFGKESLYLCGNEWIGKSLLGAVLSLAGLTITIGNPFVSCVYALAAMAINMFFVIPVEKRITTAFKNNFNANRNNDVDLQCKDK